MRLSTIKLSGFKSFVDPTAVDFPTNLMGVVGPNGCGKSNIIDAVRWVMGEISARQLRGESMSDVIFSGSKGRKPVATATVELVFDNSDGRAGGEYAEYSEISVKRQVSRDGQSNYFLNGTRCRRKDITDLFLGTGLGPRSYAIIEQGMISQIVEARPEELRGFLEEAAGISLYKERRRETENRIRHTRENLERLEDLREEVGKQMNHLQRQARAAERYRKYKQQHREDEARLLALRWRELKQRSADDEQKLKDTENRLQEAVSRQRAAEKELEALRAGQHAARDENSKIQGEMYEVAGQIAKIEQRIEHQRELRARQQKEYTETEARLNELKQHLQLDKAQVENVTGELARLEPELEQAQQREASCQDKQEKAEAAMQAWQEQWEKHSAAAGAAQREAELRRMRIEHLDERMAQARQRLDSLRGASGGQAREKLEAELGQARDGLKALEQALAEARANAGTRREELEKTRASAESEGNRRQELLQARREHSGRLESLRVLNRAADGGKALRAWAEKHGVDATRHLLNRLDVDAEWTRAAEAALGAWLHALPVENWKPEWLANPPKAELLLLEAGGNDQPGRAGTLAAHVRGAGRLSGWLESVHVADGLEAARRMSQDLPAHESVVTRDGVWLGPGWVRLGSGNDARDGVLERSREIKKLEKALQELSGEVAACESALEQARNTRAEQEDALRQAETAVHEKQREHAEKNGLLVSLQSRLEAEEKRARDNAREIEELETGLKSDTEAVAESRRELEAAIAEMERCESGRGPLQAERKSLAETLEGARRHLREAREARERVAMNLNSRQANLESLRQSINRSDSQVAGLQNRFVELSEALARGAQPEEKEQEKLNELLKARVEVESRLSESRAKLEELEAAWREQDEARQEAVAEAESIRESQSAAQLALKEVELKAANLAERVAELDGDLQSLVEALPESPDTAAWEEELEKLAERIRRLEPVNLAAIQEFEQTRERKEYLDAQYEDLTEALSTLQQAISRIDRTTRTRFKETFDKVNKGMETLFPRLFAGGHASLELVGEDLLDAGVAIMARPPGKRNARIHLLSGGEKAMTAVAFVFSIFNLNPAPFCLLDEVDAPLDDANVGRFSDMVREMSDQVQFIVVTHNKITMEITHQLVGITMREPGVSRLVSVDLDKAVAMVAS